MDQFIVNIIHRPEMVPEYAEKVTGHGKEEDIGRKSLLTESLDIFKFQQETAHKNGLKTTIQMTYASLFNEEAIAIAKEHHEKYGDEIALSLLGLPCEEFRAKYKTKDFCIWMFSMEDKMSIVDDVFGKFYDIFGFYPESTGSYYMDAELTNYIKEKYPMVKCAVATCWEEGPKAYHTCNNSWYTLMDGGPWNPWIPSKQNIHAPAANEAEDSGIVAIPHLSRDLLACYDGNGSNFGTHPQNVLRGMIYDTETWEYPYLYNLIDQYRALEKYNNGYAYNMMFVGPGWLNKMGRWEAPYELLKKSYEDGMAYYGQLKKEGKLSDMTMAEFADYFRQKKTYTEPECALWRDILYGSDKQLFCFWTTIFRSSGSTYVQLPDNVLGVFCGDSFVGILSTNTKGDTQYRLDLYNKRGKHSGSVNFTMQYTDIDIAGDKIYIHNDQECQIFTAGGRCLFKGKFEKPVYAVIPGARLSDLLVVTDGEVDSVRLH